jgi:hypothetical protein
MGDIINFEDIPTWDKEFAKLNDKNSIKDCEIVDVIDIKELRKHYEKFDIFHALDTVFEEVNLGYIPTYGAFIDDETITIFYDKECPEDEKEEDKYDREEFMESLLETLKVEEEMK